jgi:hypothetical protein
MALFNTSRIENTEIDIYLKYDYLDTSLLTDLFGKLNNLYRSLPEELDGSFNNFLEIESINTGQSIRIRFKEGWKPKIRVRRGELEVGVPANLGIPAILIYFLLTGAQKITDMRNDYLDGQLKEMDIKLKRIELYEKIEESGRFKQSLERQAVDTINILFHNQDIKHVEINDVTIKDKNKSNGRTTLSL